MILRRFHRIAKCIDVSQEVRNALEAKRPVVALESTIITHGMPFPHNKETALEVENIVREQGAVPATIAIINGRIKVGLSLKEVELLASLKPNSEVLKTSRRDLAYVISKGLSGGTTVSGTMLTAHSVGIKIFVTGGVGGVHRGGEDTMDVSADLTELGRTPVTVVCSGVKSILDIGRTLEYLETQGVCVVVYGSSRQFPAFYCEKSEFLAPYSLSTPEEVAALVQSQQELQLQSGTLLAVPVPREHQLIDDASMETAIQNALKMAEEKNIKGKDVTPFILEHLKDVTGGKSLHTNIALIKNNAMIGAKVAVALADKTSGSINKDTVKQPEFNNIKRQTFPNIHSSSRATKLRPIVIGGSNMDSVVSVKEPFKVEGRTLQGHIRSSGGGVGRNIADALAKLSPYLQPKLVSAVGDDLYGTYLIEQTVNHLDHSGVLVSKQQQTASYTCVLDHRGEMRLGVGDMSIHDVITTEHVSKYLQDPLAVVIDGNIPAETIFFVLEHCSKYGIPVVFEPTDVSKATIPFMCDAWKGISLITPNIKELRKIATFVGLDVGSGEDQVTSLEEVVSMASPLAKHIQTVMVTLGALGVLMVGRPNPGASVTARYYACSPLDHVQSVSGAGDCLAAGVISGMLAGLTEAECVSVGLAAAHDSLHSFTAVPQQFSTQPKPVQFSLVESTLKRSLL
ncbi:uncharacterized protein LOC129000928 [Macrosteles quadrilineatus]|uniref:uncharacterized protein LOC129000928 n=1 Tax=Macrosteles quadrilineatus TaxID=74068 RepID=UPI0023E2CC2F|nr:uncharacterized protein LOC129000928 [Macrosteles quadrilineatus]